MAEGIRSNAPPAKDIFLQATVAAGARYTALR